MKNQVLAIITISAILTLATGSSHAHQVSTSIESRELSGNTPVRIKDTNIAQYYHGRNPRRGYSDRPSRPRRGNRRRSRSYYRKYLRNCNYGTSYNVIGYIQNT